MQSDANSVWFRASRDAGRSWTPVQLVSRSGQYPAFQTQLLVNPQGGLHLLWKQTRSDGAFAIRDIRSSDHGATWSQPDDIVPGVQFDGVRSIIDRCETVHVVYEDWNSEPDRVHIDYVRWNGRWSKPVHLFDGFVGMTPDLRLAASGEPELVFVGRPSSIPGRPFATYVSKLSAFR
jgi:hypothetical protein